MAKNDFKNEDDVKNEDGLKVKTTSKIAPPLKFFLPPPLKKLPEILLMTSHRDSHTTTDVKPEMIPGL